MNLARVRASPLSWLRRAAALTIKLFPEHDSVVGVVVLVDRKILNEPAAYYLSEETKIDGLQGPSIHNHSKERVYN